MQEFELPAAFYLGRKVETPDGDPGAPVLLKARDLTTHAVCVGMTGSGKTGLGVGILEEAVLDGIPSIIIDPKGDMANLLLTFPELRPSDFEPWLSPSEASRKGLSMADYAVEMAETWKSGIERDGQSAERIGRLKSSAEFRVYTPGSEAGLPISVVQTLSPPAQMDWENDSEALTERIQSSVSALLALVGEDADPVRSRAHILLTNIVQEYWLQEKELSLPELIRTVQKPPITQMGVFDLETFYPEKDRMELAMGLNTIIAAPSFASWLKGEALDPQTLFWSPEGKPRVSIFSTAHLGDRERMFFTTLLLEQLVGWMRAQPGSTGLRALVYFDELFGYLPPHPVNPPSKRPLLTLLKQARAVGLGLILATQNPVDLDYKGLSNAGVWLIGRLQTERDKERLLEGLTGVQTAGMPLDRRGLDRTISDLPGRRFVYHNVHGGGPILFQTRWVMSYLAGPMTRDQIKVLMKDKKAAARGMGAPVGRAEFCANCGGSLTGTEKFCANCGSAVPAIEPGADERAFKRGLYGQAAGQPAVAGYSGNAPLLPSSVRQFYMPAAAGVSRIGYDPVVLAQASVSILDQKRDVDFKEEYLLAIDPPREGFAAQWDGASKLELGSSDLLANPVSGAMFGTLPASVNSSQKLNALKVQLSDHLYMNTRVTLFYSEKLKVYSRVGESFDDFQARLKEVANEERDEQIEKLTDRYEVKMERLEVRLGKEERELEEDKAEVSGRKREEIVSAAESVIGFLIGRRSTRVISQASRRRRMSRHASDDVNESEETIELYREQLEELKDELLEDVEEIQMKWADEVEEIDEFHVKPRRADIRVSMIALGWRPNAL